MKQYILIGLGWLSLFFLDVASKDTENEIALIRERRISDLAEFPNPPWFENISTWLSSQKNDGTWEDVDYTAGCPAQRANWPIQEHWNRIITFAAAWSGANPAVSSTWKHDNKLFDAVSKGLDYWFDNDYEPADCVGDGGKENSSCPCGTPGLWNSNWYDQAVLIPQLSSTACLLVSDGNLTMSQQDGCKRIPGRSYDRRDGTYGDGGHLTAANVALVMQSAVSMALYTDNATVLDDALSRAMAVMTYADKPMEDGIHRDGTFLQHKGVLYNGNYGKDLFNIFIQLEGEVIGTQFAAGNATREGIAAYLRGSEWMIYADQSTKQERWDLNAVGRFASFPTVDLQANADINFNISKLAKAVADFDPQLRVADSVRRLRSNGTEKLTGNKGFWASDYMVHRRDGFLLGNKMISKRSTSSETVNSANRYAYHWGQGNLFLYVEGNEYKDIMAPWDWNLIPGTTVLLNTPDLQTANPKTSGKTDFVGVVSDGRVGTSVMSYIEPTDGNLTYQKSWFFINDFVVVITNKIKKAKDVPVITVLDNRATSGGKILVDEKRVKAGTNVSASGQTLYYGGNGYIAYDTTFNLTISEGDRTGNWSEISTSKEGVVTLPIFSAYTTLEKDAFTYAVFPATSLAKLAAEAKKPTFTPIVQDGVTGVRSSGRLSLVFWPGGPKSINLNMAELGWGRSGSVEIASNEPAAYLFSTKCKRAGKGFKLVITLADPTQNATSLAVSLDFGEGDKAPSVHSDKNEGFERHGSAVRFVVQLPKGGSAGSSVVREAYINL